MRTRSLSVYLPAALGLAILLTSADALALDAWRDRRGLFFGLTLGAGPGQTSEDGAQSHMGVDARLRLGAGRSKRLTFDGELGVHHEAYGDEAIAADGRRRAFDVSTQIYTVFGGASFFIIDGLYLRGMAGFAQISTSAESKPYVNTSGGGASVEQDDGGLKLPSFGEMGMGVGAGLGYEFFAGADLAVGLSGDGRYYYFSETRYTVMTIGFNATWY
ncbi:hypothetical protein KKF91_04480 [Myxococcota bacterium]|nr:hypothetical protein [Myxococcota bacterium]MBU1429803.1 hypothetical protein [Myxococcota bacterium]MBU1898232.1 hypothetical protein [Myxococcota bacterium]